MPSTRDMISALIRRDVSKLERLQTVIFQNGCYSSSNAVYSIIPTKYCNREEGLTVLVIKSTGNDPNCVGENGGSLYHQCYSSFEIHFCLFVSIECGFTPLYAAVEFMKDTDGSKAVSALLLDSIHVPVSIQNISSSS